MSILVITTCGTIGALPYPDPKNPPPFISVPPNGEDLIRDALQTVFAAVPTRCTSLEPRDSKNMDEGYLQNMLHIMEQAPETKILITHGTDAIIKTADYFHHQSNQRAALKNKRIMLTGAMTPLSNGPESDGHQNLAFALDQLTHALPSLPPLSIVLSDFNGQGAWKPRFYPHQPNHYEKFYDTDGRYHRIRALAAV